MFCKLISYALIGIQTIKIDVEIDLCEGLPSFDIVGLPDSAVKESKERVKSALKNSGFQFPIRRITVNLAPADLRKEGSLYDLPIALGILVASQQLDAALLHNRFFAGELSLDGCLRHTRGLVPILSCSQLEVSESIVPLENASELEIVHSSKIIYCKDLNEVITFLKTGEHTSISPKTSLYTPITPLDFYEVKGQETIKRGLMVAAAGFHNILMIGPPGSGKTMLAKRLPSIMPPLAEEERLEVTKIYSVADRLHQTTSLSQRPFRAPHHTITTQGLTGGGTNPRPGEISLSHQGVLFLDELLEFNKKSLEVLRQPLEEGSITLSRVRHTVTYPAHFLLVASTNPCPCGHYPNPERCSCDVHSVKRYLQKLSGPLLDRISIQLELQPVSFQNLSETHNLSSKEMREIVLSAKERQRTRFAHEKYHSNSEIPASQLSTYCTLTPEASALLEDWYIRMHASARGHAHLLRLARTVADLDKKEAIDIASLSEAISYRLLDRAYYA